MYISTPTQTHTPTQTPTHTHTHIYYFMDWWWVPLLELSPGHGYTRLLIRVFGIFNGADSRSPGKFSAECFAAFAVVLPGMG